MTVLAEDIAIVDGKDSNPLKDSDNCKLIDSPMSRRTSNYSSYGEAAFIYPLDYSNIYSGLIVEISRVFIRWIFIVLSCWPLSAIVKGAVSVFELICLYMGYGVKLASFMIEIMVREVTSYCNLAFALVQRILYGIFVMPSKICMAVLELFTFVALVGLPIAWKARNVYHQVKPNDDGIIIKKDISYDESGSKLLDIYHQDQDLKIPSKKNVVIFFQGGSWSICKKDLYVIAGKSLSNLGYITIIPNFSTFPQDDIKSMIRDVCNILIWTHGHINEFGGDPNSIFIIGHSTGIHLVLNAFLKEFLKKEASVDDIVNLKTRKVILKSIVHMVGISGIYDLWGLVKTLENSGKSSFVRILDLFQGTPELLGNNGDLLSTKPLERNPRESIVFYSPVHMLEMMGKANPQCLQDLPTLTIIHGTSDKTSSMQYAETMSLLLSKYSGGKSGRLLLYDRASHLESLVEWLDGFDNARILNDVSNILYSYSRGILSTQDINGDDDDVLDVGPGIEVDIDGNEDVRHREKKLESNLSTSITTRNETLMWQGKKLFLRYVCPM